MYPEPSVLGGSFFFRQRSIAAACLAELPSSSNSGTTAQFMWYI